MKKTYTLSPLISLCFFQCSERSETREADKGQEKGPMDDLEIAARNLLDMNMETGPLLKLVNSVQFLYKSQKVFPEYPNILEELDKFARGLNWFLEVALRDSVIDNRVENGRVVMRPSYQSKIETVLRKLVSVGPWPHPASFEEFSKWGCKFLGQTPDIEKKIVHLGA